MRRRLLVSLMFLGLAWPNVVGQEKKVDKVPDPTFANVSYGKHERQVLDFWKAKSDKPTPLVVNIHGGGWQGGDKAKLNPGTVRQYLASGISLASINYRYVKNGVEDKVEPPVKAPLDD